MSTAYTITEVLTSVQLSFLRRVAAAGCVSIVIPDDNMVLNQLVARKLVLGNQLTDAGWKELGTASASKKLIPFALPQANDAEPAAQEESTSRKKRARNWYTNLRNAAGRKQ